MSLSWDVASKNLSAVRTVFPQVIEIFKKFIIIIFFNWDFYFQKTNEFYLKLQKLKRISQRTWFFQLNIFF